VGWKVVLIGFTFLLLLVGKVSGGLMVMVKHRLNPPQRDKHPIWLLTTSVAGGGRRVNAGHFLYDDVACQGDGTTA
jgi:hypothetical protein